MAFNRKIVLLTLCFLSVFLISYAKDESKILTAKCRSNIEALNAATSKFIKDHPGTGLPTWSTYDNMKTMILGVKYLPKDPVPPTKDCEYCFVSLGPNNFQWYCNLHGVIRGSKEVSFYYHQYRFTARIDPEYKMVKSYQKHIKSLYEWTEYYPTIYERFQYKYNQNPISTIATLCFAGIVIIFIYKNVF